MSSLVTRVTGTSSASQVPPDQVKSFDVTSGNGPVLVSFPAA